MNGININWPSFKSKLVNTGIPHYMMYEDDFRIDLFCSIQGMLISCGLMKKVGGVQTEEYTDYLSTFAEKTDTNGGYDHAGRQIIRTATTFKGWSYLANCFTYKTCSGLVEVFDAFNNNVSSEFTVHRFDEDGELTINPLLTKKDKVVWHPNYDFDLISGSLDQASRPSERVLLWVYGGAYELGPLGNKEFARNVNLQNALTVKTDGRASKHVCKETEGVPFQTNQITFMFDHPVGFEHEISFMLEVYRK